MGPACTEGSSNLAHCDKLIFIWVVVYIRVPFRVLSIRVPYYIGDPKQDPNSENCPYGPFWPWFWMVSKLRKYTCGSTLSCWVCRKDVVRQQLTVWGIYSEVYVLNDYPYLS